MEDQRNVLADRRPAHRLLATVFRHGGPWVAVLPAASLLLAAAETALPALLGRALDAVVTGDDAGRWLVAAALLVAVLTFSDTLDDLAAGLSSARATSWLRRSVLGHVLATGPRAARRFAAGDLVTRLVANAAEAGRFATVSTWAVTSVLPALGGVVALALIDPWLCLAFLAGAPLLIRLVRSGVRDASDLADDYLRVQGGIASRLLDALAGARSIAAAGTWERERDRVLAPLPELHRHGTGMWDVQTRLASREALLVPLLEVVVLAVAGFELARGRITVGDLLAASQYVVLAAGLGSVAGVAPQLAMVRSAAGRTAQVFAEPPVRYGTEPLPPGPGRLEFRGVGAGTVLRDLDLDVPGGVLVALVGRSGSGKSLLAALAGRLTDPDEGEVRLDGVALPRLDRRELRAAVGYGFERPVLLGETLADVIAFGQDVPTDARVTAAARDARADGFVRRMPEGYRSRLADARMSGGEVQRLGLARAFVHAGRVLVLDDVAASLDTVTEHHIQEVLTGPLADRTRLVVAHRASTASRADLVVWLDGGRVRAVGPHHDLAADPEYRALFGPAAVAPRVPAGRPG